MDENAAEHTHTQTLYSFGVYLLSIVYSPAENRHTS